MVATAVAAGGAPSTGEWKEKTLLQSGHRLKTLLSDLMLSCLQNAVQGKLLGKTLYEQKALALAICM